MVFLNPNFLKGTFQKIGMIQVKVTLFEAKIFASKYDEIGVQTVRLNAQSYILEQ
jgi:hypothetical protein